MQPSARMRVPMNDPALILIVEDNPGSLMLATVALEIEGFAVAGAETAAQARTLLAHSTPDLILMDIQLPDADGLEFTKELKADPATAGIPVIALTAHAMPLHERAARAAGCAGFIAKPWTPEALSRDVRAILAIETSPR
ncbi:MAG TPA: response regulator [Candidatus Dormibacteraeota bacterium]|nr:response regulator [Candidatus Dormibacteraeota bacterium]